MTAGAAGPGAASGRRGRRLGGPRAPAEDPAARLEELRRAERSMVLVRWVAVAFAAGQVLVYTTLPYPPGVREAGLLLAGVLAAGNVAIWAASRRTATLPRAQALALASLSFDILVAAGFGFLYAFDPISALWAILYVLPLEGAIRFRLPGALGAWAASTLLYAAREVWGSARYGYALEWNSVSFRMGIGLLIALVAGLMARNLTCERTRAQAAFRELQKVDGLRANLVSMLAHDVRNPLFTIRGTLRMLLSHPDRLGQSTGPELLAAADHQAARLERLAVDLLDLARLESGRLELRRERLGLAEAVSRALGFADPEGRFEVRIDPDLEVQADPGRLEQIVVNLATNALQYGEPPFVVEGDREGGSVRLAFRDWGPGVPPEARAALFEPFRGKGGGRSVGFGLAIVRALAEAHGGDVSFEPQEPQGSCFKVRLPAP